MKDSRTLTANNYADLIIRKKWSTRQVAKNFRVSQTTVSRYLDKYVTGILRKFLLKRQLKKNSKKYFND